MGKKAQHSNTPNYSTLDYEALQQQAADMLADACIADARQHAEDADCGPDMDTTEGYESRYTDDNFSLDAFYKQVQASIQKKLGK